MKDDPFPTYEGLVEYLKELPATWYPALIQEMVKAAWRKKVFVKGGASRLIAQFENRNGWGAPDPLGEALNSGDGSYKP